MAQQRQCQYYMPSSSIMTLPQSPCSFSAPMTRPLYGYLFGETAQSHAGVKGHSRRPGLGPCFATGLPLLSSTTRTKLALERIVEYFITNPHIGCVPNTLQTYFRDPYSAFTSHRGH